MQFEKHMTIALALSTTFMLVNIIAVTTGVADAVYTPLSQWLMRLL